MHRRGCGVPFTIGIANLEDLRRRFKVVLRNEEQETAGLCWGDAPFGQGENEVIRGLGDIAWAYSRLIQLSFGDDLQPGELETRLKDISKQAKELRKGINFLKNKQTFLRKIGEDPPCARAKAFRNWFVIHPGTDGRMVEALEELEKFSKELAAEVGFGKLAKAGARPGRRRIPVEFLFRGVGAIVLVRGRPKTHILPIGRVIHEWSTGGSTGEKWGERPLARLRPALEQFQADLPILLQELPDPSQHTRLLQFLVNKGVVKD